MTTTPDIRPDPDQVDDVDEQPAVEPSKPTPGKPAAPKPKQATHTNVPAALAGPKRRAALALGLPGAGLAEMLTHANFGWPGVLIGTGTALAGAGVAYVVRKRRQEREQDKSKQSRATAKPGGVARRVAGRLGLRSSGLASRAGAAGGPKRSAAGRVLSRVAGAGRGAGKAGAAAGGGKRAGRAGVRSALGSVGAGGRAAAAGKRTAGHRTPPGARTAAQAAGRRGAGLAGGAGRRSGGRGLPKLGGSSRRAGGSSTSSKGHSTAGRSAGRSGRGGGSGVSRLFGRSGGGRSGAGRPGGGRSAGRTSAGRRTGSGARTGGSARKGRAGGSIPRLAGHGRSRSSWGAGTSRHNARRPAGHGKQTAGTGGQARRSPINRHHSRIQWRDHRREAGIFGLTVGGVLLAPLLAPTALGVVGVLGTGLVYGGLAVGGYWLARNPKVRYGASTIAGWTKLTMSRAYQWARLQWWKSRGKTTKPASKTPWWTPSWSRNPKQPTPAPEPEVMDAEIVPDPPAPAPRRAALPVAARQPEMTRRAAPSPSTAVSIRQENPTVSALDQITEALVSAPAFTPTSGPDAEHYMESVVNLLSALGARVSGDLQGIGETLPQQSESLGSLNQLGAVLGAFAAQAGEQVEQWKQNANWVWNQG